MPHQWFRGIRIPDKYELDPLKTVSREEWGAVPPTETKFLKKPIRTLVFAFNTEMETCTNMEECSAAMRELQQRHMALGYPDIYYNFGVGGDGRVYEGRGWDAWHSANYSCYFGRTLVIGIIGQGKDIEGDWYWPFGMGTIKIVRIGDETFKFPYFEKEKLYYETYDKIEPYDPNNTEEISLVKYPTSDEEEEGGKEHWRQRRRRKKRKVIENDYTYVIK